MDIIPGKLIVMWCIFGALCILPFIISQVKYGKRK